VSAPNEPRGAQVGHGRPTHAQAPLMRRLKDWWRGVTKRLDPLVTTAVLIFLLVLGVVVTVLAFAIPPFSRSQLLQVLGPAMLGVALTALVGTLTGREAIRQQSAKEVNLARKRETYGPLYAEVKALRQAMSDAEAGDGPPPFWIDTGVAVKRAGISSIPIPASAPTLKCWPEFKRDYRDMDFTPAAQQRLQALQTSADTYNNAIEAARVAAIPLLAGKIDTAVADLRETERYKQWRQRHAEQQAQHLPVGHAPKLEDDWYGYLDDTEEHFAKPNGQTLGQNLAAIWLGNWPQSYPSHAPGWLFAGHVEEAARYVWGTYPERMDPPPPRLEWIEGVFVEAQAVLQQDQAFAAASSATTALTQCVTAAEEMLEQGLRRIQERYEGGEPLI
jgi:hypothetical protein